MTFEFKGTVYRLEFKREHKLVRTGIVTDTSICGYTPSVVSSQAPCGLMNKEHGYGLKEDGHNFVPADLQPSKYPYTTVTVLKQLDTVVGKTKTGKDIYGTQVFRTYTVGAHHTETFKPSEGVIEKGRRAALKMLSKGNGLSKEFKAAMWKAYMERPRPKSEPKPPKAA